MISYIMMEPTLFISFFLFGCNELFEQNIHLKRYTIVLYKCQHQFDNWRKKSLLLNMRFNNFRKKHHSFFFNSAFSVLFLGLILFFRSWRSVYRLRFVIREAVTRPEIKADVNPQVSESCPVSQSPGTSVSHLVL